MTRGNTELESPIAYGLGLTSIQYRQEARSNKEGEFYIGYLPDQPLSLHIAQEMPGQQAGNSARRVSLEWFSTFNLDRPIEEGTELVIGDDEIDVIGKVILPENEKMKVEDGKVFVTKWETARTSPFMESTAFCRVSKDGMFRIPNLKPGQYHGRLVMMNHDVFSASMTSLEASDGFRSTEFEYEFQLTPEMFEGRGPGNPVDLGEIKLEGGK